MSTANSDRDTTEAYRHISQHSSTMSSLTLSAPLIHVKLPTHYLHFAATLARLLSSVMQTNIHVRLVLQRNTNYSLLWSTSTILVSTSILLGDFCSRPMSLLDIIIGSSPTLPIYLQHSTAKPSAESSNNYNLGIPPSRLEY